MDQWINAMYTFYRFLYDGTRINDDDTPNSLDMEDNGEASFLAMCPPLTSSPDTIDVMVERSYPSHSLRQSTEISRICRGRREVTALIPFHKLYPAFPCCRHCHSHSLVYLSLYHRFFYHICFCDISSSLANSSKCIISPSSLTTNTKMAIAMVVPT